MWNFINRNYWNVIIVAAVVLGLICGVSILARRGNDTGTPAGSNIANIIFTPVKSGLTNMGNGINDFFGSMVSAKNAADENRELKNKIKILQNENARMDEYKNENERLRKLLEFKQKQSHFSTVACTVVGREFSNWNTEFVIDKGTSSGIDVGNVVIQNNGLVGSVTMAGTNWAKVTTLLDGDTSVSASIIRTGETGIVEGDILLADKNLCHLDYTGKNSDIAIGDTVETSGLGKVYPQGIIIGKVKKVETISGEVTKKITVEVSADISNIKEVLVITAY
ncbi:MAG: rod shape-determining protein MreC [Bacillota bacterium]|nr:rod shape-determining protein MreC [Bacillota bacterium]